MVMNLFQRPKPIQKRPISPTPLIPTPTVGRPVAQPIAAPQSSTGLAIASQSRPTPHQGQMGATGAMQTVKPPQVAPTSLPSNVPVTLNNMRPNANRTMVTLDKLSPTTSRTPTLFNATAASQPSSKSSVYQSQKNTTTKPVSSAVIDAHVKQIPDYTKAEIKRKALAGIPMDTTTEAKRYLYDFYKYEAANPPPPPVYTNVSDLFNPAQTTVRDVNGTAAPVNNGQANWNSNQSIPDYGAMTPEMIKQIQNGYLNNPAYDPATDPAYQASLALANKQANAAGLSTMEDMNERGILNSTITSDRVGQIKQGASDAVIGNIPGLQANYNNNHQNNMNGLSNLLNTTIGASQFQQTFAEGNRQFDKNFSLDEAETTGRYMPPEAQALIDSVINAKKITSMTNISPQDRAKAGEQANAARAKLSAMGIDISGIGGSVGYQDAITNLSSLGRNTLPQQKMDLDKTEVMGRQVDTTAQGLIQQVLQSKSNNEKGIGNREGNAKAANDARAKLSALGFDISGIAGNVSYAQSIKNAANLGKPTLEAVDIAADNKLDRDKLTADTALGNKELDLSRDKLTADTALGNRELAWKEQDSIIRADLDSRGLDLDEVRNEIDWFAAESDADYKLRQDNSGISEQDAYTNTNKAIGHIAGAKTAAEGWAYIHSQTQAWGDSGVDFKEVVAALEKKFPGSTKKSSEEEDFPVDYDTDTP